MVTPTAKENRQVIKVLKWLFVLPPNILVKPELATRFSCHLRAYSSERVIWLASRNDRSLCKGRRRRWLIIIMLFVNKLACWSEGLVDKLATTKFSACYCCLYLVVNFVPAFWSSIGLPRRRLRLRFQLALVLCDVQKIPLSQTKFPVGNGYTIDMASWEKLYARDSNNNHHLIGVTVNANASQDAAAAAADDDGHGDHHNAWQIVVIYLTYKPIVVDLQR